MHPYRTSSSSPVMSPVASPAGLPVGSTLGACVAIAVLVVFLAVGVALCAVGVVALFRLRSDEPRSTTIVWRKFTISTQSNAIVVLVLGVGLLFGAA